MALGALLALTAAVRLAIAFADHRSLIAAEVYQDDAFYYLEIARNIVAGRGPSFDGSHATAGFQPLYLLLLLPLAWGLGDSPAALVHASACLLAGFATATTWLVFRLTRELGATRGAWLAAALWAVAPYFAVMGTNGQETGLAVFFALAALRLYVRDFVHAPAGDRRRALRFGAVCGLGLLARLDLALLLLALAGHWLWARARGRRPAGELRCALLAALACGLVILPWAAVSRTQTGAWLPTGGAASREIALHYGWANLERIWSRPDPSRPQPYFDPERVPPAWYADVASKQVAVFLVEHPLLAPLRAHVLYGVWPPLERYPPYRWLRRAPLATTALALLLAAVFAWGWRRRAAAACAPRGLGALVAGYGLLFGLGYTFYAPAHWYFARYCATPIAITLVCALPPLERALRSHRTLASAAAGGLLAWQLLSLAGFAAGGLRWSRAEAGGFLRSWHALAPRIEPGARLGAFQAGIYGYFGDRDVVNLDGKVNPAAARALREKRLDRYLADEGIDYVLDWEWVLYALCTRHLGPDPAVRFRKLAQEDRPDGAALFAVLPAR